MLKILQTRLQLYVSRELPDVQAGFRKGRETRDQISNICWIIQKSKRVPEKYLFLGSPAWQADSLPSELQVVVVQLPSCVQLCSIPWTTARQACLSLTISWSLPRFTSIELVMPSNHLILCHRLLLPPSIFPSIRVFSNESVFT